MAEPAGDVDAELLETARDGRDVYEELLCDWPLLAPDDARTLTEALRQV